MRSVSACLWPPERRPTGWLIRSSSPISSFFNSSRKRSFSCFVVWESHPPLPAASARFSSIVIPGAVPLIGSWYRRPILLARICCGVKVISSPSRMTEPESVRKSPQTVLKNVDLPAPLEPMIVAKSPFFNSSEKSSRAFFSFTVPGLNVFEIWLIFSMDHLPPFWCVILRRICGHCFFR